MILSARTLPRAAALALALLATAAAQALGTPQQVLEDYNLDGRIDAVYSVHDLRGALALPATTSQYGSFGDAVQARLTEELAGSAPPGQLPPQDGQPQYGAAPAPSGSGPAGATPRSPSRTGGAAPRAAPSVRPSRAQQPAPRSAPSSPTSPTQPAAAARPPGQRLLNRIQDLGSEVLVPPVVVPPRLATFPSPPPPSSEQRLPEPFVPLAALAALLLAAGVMSGVWRSLRTGRGRRNGRRRIEGLRLGE